MSDAERRRKAVEARRTGYMDAWTSPTIRKGLVHGGKPFPDVSDAGDGLYIAVLNDGEWMLMKLPVDDDGRLKITLDPYSRRLLESLVIELQQAREKQRPVQPDKRVRARR